MSSLIDRVNRLLPQTNCQRCHFQGCLPYAEAIVSGTPHNQCPPGGQKTIRALSDLLSRPELPLNTEHGFEGQRVVAVIREAECIGCTKCLQACPVDAISGAGKWMHTVITNECSGCELCVDPCPVDCISLVPAPAHLQPDLLSDLEQEQLRQQFKERYEQKNARVQQLKTQEIEEYQEAVLAGKSVYEESEGARLSYIEEAKARVLSRKKNRE